MCRNNTCLVTSDSKSTHVGWCRKLSYILPCIFKVPYIWNFMLNFTRWNPNCIIKRRTEHLTAQTQVLRSPGILLWCFDNNISQCSTKVGQTKLQFTDRHKVLNFACRRAVIIQISYWWNVYPWAHDCVGHALQLERLRLRSELGSRTLYMYNNTKFKKSMRAVTINCEFSLPHLNMHRCTLYIKRGVCG